MKIGGVPFKVEYVSDFTRALGQLRPAVAMAQRQPKRITWSDKTPHGEAMEQAEAAWRNWGDGGSDASIGTATEHYESAYAKAVEAEELLVAGKAMQRLAELQLSVAKRGKDGNPAALVIAAKAADRAISTYLDADAPANMGQVAHLMGTGILSACHLARLSDGWPSQAKLEEKAERYLVKCRDAYRLAQGPEIAGALRVDQGEFGVSDSTPIGTDNVQDCISMVVRNPQSGVTALAHIDGATSGESLSRIMDAVPQPDDDTALDVKLIGAKPWSNGPGNLEKVWKLLDGRNVNVTAASVSQRVQGTCYVVDPKTGELTAGFPGIEPMHGDLSNARAMIVSDYPVSCAFDTRKSMDRNPVGFERAALSNLDMRYPSDSLNDVFSEVDGRYGGMGTASAVWAIELLEMRRAITEARKGINDQLNARFDSLQDQGIKVPATARMMAREVVLRIPLYAGEGADQANRVVVDALMGRAFPLDAEGKLGFSSAAVDGLKLSDLTGNSPEVEAMVDTTPKAPPKPANQPGQPPGP